MKLLHTADLHPNAAATLAGKTVLDPVTSQCVPLIDLAKSLSFLADTVREERCDAILIAGDLWDSCRPHANEVRVIREAVIRLAHFGTVICIAGNHDVSNNPSDATALECLKGVPNVIVVERPQRITLEHRDQPINIFCLPYPRKAQLLTQAEHQSKSPEELTALVNHGLVSILRSFSLEVEPNALNILLAHGSVSNCKVNDQPRSLSHDILIPLELCQEFDYCAFGHIHQAQVLNDAGTAWYSGSLMRNGFGEEHEEKGFNLVTLEPGHAADVEFVRNPFARTYQTIKAVDLQEDVLSVGLARDVVWRFKDQLNAGDYQILKPLLDRLQAETPLCQVDVELLSEDRARDAGMAACLSMEEALTRALTGTIDEADLPAVVEKHQLLVQECAA